MRRWLLVLVVGSVMACQQKMPTAAAPAPGKAPSWGQGFGAQQPSTPSTPPSFATDPAARDAVVSDENKPDGSMPRAGEDAGLRALGATTEVR